MIKGLMVSNLSFDLNGLFSTLEIIFLFFIFALLIIFTATLAPVSSCLPSKCW